MAYTIADEGEADHREEQIRMLESAVKTVSFSEVMLLKLKYEDNLDIRQIAAHFNLKDSAVKMRLKRTRDKIRRHHTYRQNA